MLQLQSKRTVIVNVEAPRCTYVEVNRTSDEIERNVDERFRSASGSKKLLNPLLSYFLDIGTPAPKAGVFLLESVMVGHKSKPIKSRRFKIPPNQRHKDKKCDYQRRPKHRSKSWTV